VARESYTVEILTFELTPFAMNCYVLKDGGQAIVIDPGEDAPELRRALVGCDVKMICNTHCHIDHCGGNAGLVAHTGAPLACHKADLMLLHALEQQSMMFGVASAESPEPDQFLEEGDTIDVGSVRLRVLHTPGHAPGHIVLVGDGFLFAGDVLFAGSIGRTDLPGGNHAQLLASIHEKLLGLPSDTVVYSGHGPTTTIGRERASNPFLV
jgi:glyoxylase-like metal-dependent hydrolase (beta-lactamase superfamily II)